MNNSDPAQQTLNPNKNKKLIFIFAGLGFLIVIIIAGILIFVNRENKVQDSNAVDTPADEDNSNEDLPGDGGPTLLKVGVCPDKVSFNPSLLAELDDKEYLLSGEALSWVEANCPETEREGTGTPADSGIVLPWSYSGNDWVAAGTAPACSDPLEIMTPVDMSLVSGILYPGQVRGGDYKPHGGFAFDNQSNNKVTVKLPEDAVLWRAVGYIQDGEVQYMADFLTECGIAYRFDHLLTLSDKLLSVMSKLPQPVEDSRTHFITPPVEFKKGDVLATEVGFRSPLNVGFDLGVYDLRQRNAVSQNNPTWAAAHKDESELAYYGICWLDHLAGQDKVTARSLKARGAYGNEGKESDYCD